MPLHHGNDGVVKVGSDDIGKLVKWTLKETVATSDASAAGETHETHTSGKAKWEGTIDVRYLDGDTAQDALVAGASVALSLYPETDGSGAQYRSGTATITSVDLDSEHTGTITRSYSYLGNGTLTTAMVA